MKLQVLLYIMFRIKEVQACIASEFRRFNSCSRGSVSSEPFSPRISDDGSARRNEINFRLYGFSSRRGSSYRSSTVHIRSIEGIFVVFFVPLYLVQTCSENGGRRKTVQTLESVSYTHLTLPTIYSV